MYGGCALLPRNLLLQTNQFLQLYLLTRLNAFTSAVESEGLNNADSSQSDCRDRIN